LRKACGGCPHNKCHNCPVKIEDLEEVAIRAALNHGAPESMWIPDPDTGEMIYVKMRDPSDEAVALLKKIYGRKE
jgi:hypothetical protein